MISLKNVRVQVLSSLHLDVRPCSRSISLHDINEVKRKSPLFHYRFTSFEASKVGTLQQGMMIMEKINLLSGKN